jgi:cephalosporin hydroxylase
MGHPCREGQLYSRPVVGLIGRLRGEVQALRRILRRRAYLSRSSEQDVVTRFHRLLYDAQLWGGTWAEARWMGVPISKMPFDLWAYQEILFETRPEIIVETGTYRGGSALLLAHLCELLGHGRVLTIDIVGRADRPHHERLSYLTGSSVAPEILQRVRSATAGRRAMVILDSDHSEEHVLTELRTYGPLVTPGCYLIVEDTNVGGHPVHPDHGPGPTEAFERFFKDTDDFEVDRTREKFLVSFNPGGYLKRRMPPTRRPGSEVSMGVELRGRDSNSQPTG